MMGRRSEAQRKPTALAQDCEGAKVLQPRVLFRRIVYGRCARGNLRPDSYAITGLVPSKFTPILGLTYSPRKRDKCDM